MTAGLAQAATQPGALRLIQAVDIPSSYGRFRSQVGSYYEAEVRAEAKHQNEQYLQAVTKRFADGSLAKYHLALTTAVVTDPDVAEAIVQTAEQGKVDFIAMATHGRGGVQHWAVSQNGCSILPGCRFSL